MKKYLLTAIAVLICASASAQYPVRRASVGHGPSASSSHSAFWGRRRADKSFLDVHFTYSPTKLELKQMSFKDKTSYNSVGGGLKYDLSFFHTPLYFEAGLNFRYSWHNGSTNKALPLLPANDASSQTGSKFFDISIPFGLMYKLHLGNTRVALAPYIGFDADIFALGKFTKALSRSEEIDMDIFKDQYAANRFVFGWHAGGRLYMGPVFLGVGYEGPLSHFVKSKEGSTDFHYCDISVGLCF